MSEPLADERLAEIEARRLGIAPKRVLRFLEKWNGAGWWEFGVLLSEGWWTKSAPEELSA